MEENQGEQDVWGDWEMWQEGVAVERTRPGIGTAWLCIPAERLHSSVTRQVTPLCLSCLVCKMQMQNYLIRSIQKLNNAVHDRCLEQWLAHCRVSVSVNSFIIV